MGLMDGIYWKYVCSLGKRMGTNCLADEETRTQKKIMGRMNRFEWFIWIAVVGTTSLMLWLTTLTLKIRERTLSPSTFLCSFSIGINIPPFGMILGSNVDVVKNYLLG